MIKFKLESSVTKTYELERYDATALQSMLGHRQSSEKYVEKYADTLCAKAYFVERFQTSMVEAGIAVDYLSKCVFVGELRLAVPTTVEIDLTDGDEFAIQYMLGIVKIPPVAGCQAAGLKYDEKQKRNLIAAIKYVRSQYPLTLLQAKEAVERYESLLTTPK